MKKRIAVSIATLLLLLSMTATAQRPGSARSRRVHRPAIESVAAVYEKEEPVTRKLLKGNRFTRIAFALFALLWAAALRADGPSSVKSLEHAAGAGNRTTIGARV